jgi:hypothetical protein
VTKGSSTSAKKSSPCAQAPSPKMPRYRAMRHSDRRGRVPQEPAEGTGRASARGEPTFFELHVMGEMANARGQAWTFKRCVLVCGWHTCAPVW